jgi:OOP family OmpA-OmpF porin
VPAFLTAPDNRNQNLFMNRSRPIFLLLLCAQLAQAQGNESLRRAGRFEASGDLYNAAIQYEQYLGIRKGTSKGFAPYSPVKTGSLGKKQEEASTASVYAKLAACYYGLHDYAKAAQYYAKAGALSAADELHYIQSLRASGQKAEASSKLQALRSANLDPALQRQVALEAATLAFEAKPDALFSVSKAGGEVNTGHGNYAAVRSGSVLFFTSSRADSAAKGPNRNHIYRIVGSEALLADPMPGAAIDQGLCSFTPNGSRVFFTAWTVEGGRRNARIYTCTRADGGWTEPVLLNEKINAPGSSNAQPCYAERNGRATLYFSSDRSGGTGGFDIWSATLDAAGQATSVQVLDEHINTSGDEAAPFFHAPTQILVFASNGRPGLGGFDLYESRVTGSGYGPASNLGTPVNSVKDDSYFFSAATDSNVYRNAYLSSDRASDCCLEVFSISKADPPTVESPAPAPAPSVDTAVQKPYTFPTILFEFDRADLSAEQSRVLDGLADYLQHHTDLRIRIGGYTDGKGDDDYNIRLSDRRARAVRDYLAAKGILPGRLWIKGFGECCPVAPEGGAVQADLEARSLNRRVEIKPE